MTMQKRPCDAVNRWRSVTTTHSAIPPSTARLHLNALADQAARLAETDPNRERRVRHKKLLRYLSGRIARAILREVGRYGKDRA